MTASPEQRAHSLIDVQLTAAGWVSLPAPDEIIAEIIENVETALQKFKNVACALGT